MPHTDIDISHTAIVLIRKHGDTAPIHAAMANIGAYFEAQKRY